MLRLAYFVHDLGDAAVMRRVKMLHAGGANVTVLGFRRGATAPTTICGAPAIDLGRTRDGRLLHRAAAVLRVALRPATLRAAISDADVIMARNLETLVLAARVRGVRRLVYECLDIHRSLLSRTVAGKAVQAVERRLLAAVDLVVTSSQRYADDYFRDHRALAAPIVLVENKVLAVGDTSVPAVADRVAAGPPWIIGWYGMLRCRRSLATLTALARNSGGRVRVILAGVPSEGEVGNLAAHVAGVPGMTYMGRYQPSSLPRLYGRVHFAWAIDHFEEGRNSAWLLPNRLYEALAHCAVPIAIAGVETGAWLARHGVGLTIADDDAAAALLAAMTPTRLAAARAAIDALPRDVVTAGPADCRALVDAIAGNATPAPAARIRNVALQS